MTAPTASAASSSCTGTVAESGLPREYPAEWRSDTVTAPSGSSALSAAVGTVQATEAAPAGIMTCLSPSSPGATKSWPAAVVSRTASSTVSAAAVGPVRLTVNAAGVPSVTGEVPAAMVTAATATEMSKSSLAVPPRPSLAVTRTVTVPASPAAGVPENVRAPASKASHAGSAVPSLRAAL